MIYCEIGHFALSAVVGSLVGLLGYCLIWITSRRYSEYGWSCHSTYSASRRAVFYILLLSFCVAVSARVLEDYLYSWF